MNTDRTKEIIETIENDPALRKTLISIILKDEEAKSIIDAMITKEVDKAIKNLRIAKLDKHPKQCPECKRMLYWNNYHKRFEHLEIGPCVYMMDEYGKCIWNNGSV